MLRLEEEDIYAGIATSGSGSGSGGIPELQVLRSFGMCDVDNNVYSIEWGIEHPDLSYDTYYSTFTLEQNTDGTFNFVAGETTKDGTVVGHPHLVGWLSLYTSDITTPFALPQFSYDSETDTYSATVGEYNIGFTLETDPEVENKVNFVGGTATKDGAEVGDLNIGFWNEELPPAPVQKGSFDSATQQLTLNYDYLVEKINSSTVLTDEQKAEDIALLNNSNLVINMASESETYPEANPYVYIFRVAAGNTGLGDSFVDKQTPVTLKLTISPQVFGISGSYEAIAEFYTVISGETITPEMIEAQFAPFIVDENLCTVSGTLGNFSVEFN